MPPGASRILSRLQACASAISRSRATRSTCLPTSRCGEPRLVPQAATAPSVETTPSTDTRLAACPRPSRIRTRTTATKAAQMPVTAMTDRQRLRPNPGMHKEYPRETE